MQVAQGYVFVASSTDQNPWGTLQYGQPSAYGMVAFTWCGQKAHLSSPTKHYPAPSSLVFDAKDPWFTCVVCRDSYKDVTKVPTPDTDHYGEKWCPYHKGLLPCYHKGCYYYDKYPDQPVDGPGVGPVVLKPPPLTKEQWQAFKELAAAQPPVFITASDPYPKNPPSPVPLKAAPGAFEASLEEPAPTKEPTKAPSTHKSKWPFHKGPGPAK